MVSYFVICVQGSGAVIINEYAMRIYWSAFKQPTVNINGDIMIFDKSKTQLLLLLSDVSLYCLFTGMFEMKDVSRQGNAEFHRDEVS